MQNYDNLARHVAINAANKIDVTNPINGKPYVDWTTATNQHLQNVQKSEQHKTEYLKAQGILQNKDQYKALENPEEYKAQLEAWRQTPLAKRGDIPTPKFKQDDEKDADKNLTEQMLKGIQSEKNSVEIPYGDNMVKVTTTEKFSPLQQHRIAFNGQTNISDKGAEKYKALYESQPQKIKDYAEKKVAELNNLPNATGVLEPWAWFHATQKVPSIDFVSNTDTLHNKPSGGESGTSQINITPISNLEESAKLDPDNIRETQQDFGGGLPKYKGIDFNNVDASSIPTVLTDLALRDNPVNVKWNRAWQFDPIKDLTVSSNVVRNMETGEKVNNNTAAIKGDIIGIREAPNGQRWVVVNQKLGNERVTTKGKGKEKGTSTSESNQEYQKVLIPYNKGIKDILKKQKIKLSGLDDSEDNTTNPTAPISQQENKLKSEPIQLGDKINLGELVKNKPYIYKGKNYIWDGTKLVSK
jgi:hypothetical protein